MKKQISIREGTESDEKYVNGICEGVFNSNDYLPKIWKNWIKDKNGKFFVGTHERIPISIYHLYIEYKQAWMEALRVKNEFRKDGIGRMLLEDAIQRTQEYHSIKLLTDTDNIAALNLFEEFSFSSLSHQTMYWKPKIKNVIKNSTNEKSSSGEIKVMNPNEIKMILRKSYDNSDLIPIWWRFWNSNDEIIEHIAKRALGYSITRGAEQGQVIMMNTTEYDFRKTLHLIHFNKSELVNDIIEKISKDYNEHTIFTFQEKDHHSNDILKENGFNNRLEITILERKM